MDCSVIKQDSLANMPLGSFQEDGVHLTQYGVGKLIRNYKEVVNPLLGLADYRDYSTPRTQNYEQQPQRDLEKPRSRSRNQDYSRNEVSEESDHERSPVRTSSARGGGREEQKDRNPRYSDYRAQDKINTRARGNRNNEPAIDSRRSVSAPQYRDHRYFGQSAQERDGGCSGGNHAIKDFLESIMRQLV